MGASAAKLLVYYHPDAQNASDQERLVAEVAAACRAVDLALFVEPLSYSLAGDDFLGTTGSERLSRLLALVDTQGRPWHERSSRLTTAPAPGDGWYRGY